VRQDPQGEGRLHDSIRESDKQRLHGGVCSRFLFSCAPNYSPSLRRVTTRKICCLLRDTVPNPRASQVYFCFRDLNARGEGPVPLLFAEARVHLPGVCEGCKRK
jgi:hypothetical protein